MKALNSIIFLCTIIFGSLFLPSLISKFSLIVFILLSFGCMLNVFFKDEVKTIAFNDSLLLVDNISYSNLFYPIMTIVILVTWIISLSFSESANILSYFAIALIHMTFLLFIVITKNYIFDYFRAYIFFVFIMSISGILASTLIHFDLINISDHYVNLYQMTNGSFTRDKDFGQESYAFPYGLGMLLTASGKLNFFGIEFYRISGWAHEPSNAALFVVPAIMLLLHAKIIQAKAIRYFILATIVLFWILVMSIGSFIAFFAVYSLVLLGKIYGNFFPLKTSILSFFTLFSVILFALFSMDQIINSTVLSTKFNLDSETASKAIKELLWFIPEYGKTTVYYISHFLLWVLIGSFLFTIFLSIFQKNVLNLFSIILLYLVIQSMKGFQENVFILTFSLYWFYMAYFSIMYKDR